MDSPPVSSLPLRAVRSYARREDADHAVTHLAEHGITAVLQEQKHTDKASGLLLFRGCRVAVPTEQAAMATRLLLRMAPTEAPNLHSPAGSAAAAAARNAGSSRFFRRLHRPRQSSPLMIIGIAVLCAGFATIYGFYKMFVDRPVRGQVSDAPSYTIEEDLNYDGRIDRLLDYTPDHRLVKLSEDRNFDGEIDMITNWRQNLMISRERDIDGNGIMDERTVFGPDEQPLYVDIRPNRKGGITERRIYRGDRTLKKILRDTDGDIHFDLMLLFDETGKPAGEERLPPDSPENALPVWEPLPEDEEYDPGPPRIKVGGG